MSKFLIILLLILAHICNADNLVAPEGKFYYSGLLKFDGISANGKYDFYVELYDDKVAGNLLSEVNLTKVQVIDGSFSLNLDFTSIDIVTNKLWIEVSLKLTTDSKSFIQFLPRQPTPTNKSGGNQFFQFSFNNSKKTSKNQMSIETLKFKKIEVDSVKVTDLKALYKKQVEFAAQHAPTMYDQSLKSMLNKDEFNKIGHVHGVLREIINAQLNGEIIGNLKDLKITGDQNLADVYTVIEDQISVDITTASDPTLTLETLIKIPGVKINAMASTPSYSVVSVAVDAKSLLEMCLIPSLKSVIPVVAISDKYSRPSLNQSLQNTKPPILFSQGTANNQAEDALEVVALRRIFSGITGTGISVGIMSDSVDIVGNGIADSQSSNDLPDSSVINIIIDSTTGRDEGRAMMELIYDISPGLDTYGYATAYNSPANMATNITSLSNTGMDIIVDDIIYFNEPYFQDGIIDQAIKTFVNQGGSYFTAAGNRANQSYEATYSNFLGYHNYSGGDAFMQITLAANSTVQIYLQWAEPWGNATSNLNLELWNETVTTLLQQGSINNIGGNPNEDLTYFNNTASAVTLNIAVKRISGVSPVFKFLIRGDVSIDQFSAGATGTMKQYSRYGIATGAAPWYNRDVAEFFSSLGNITRYFDAQGSPITPLTINKPDYMSIDAGNTSFFGIDIPEDTDTLPNFKGTSAAAPNAAAVAALMLQVAGGSGSLTQNQIKDLMNKSAIDLGDPGFDTLYGNGRINALGAVMLARGPQLPESHMYLNQFGDATKTRNLLSISDVSNIMYSSNEIGSATIEIKESDIEFDPMIAVFLPDFDFVTGTDYDGGVGDDARINFTNGANFPYLFEVFSESMFTGVTAFTAKINGPNQQVTTRTGSLNVDGKDNILSTNISFRGHAEYFRYTAPFSGNVNINLTTTGFDGNLRVYNNAGDLMDSTISNAGIGKLLNIQNIIGGEDYVIQVVPNLYIGTGSFSLSVDFNENMFTLFVFTKGSGMGLVHSGTTPGINCGINCQFDYVQGQSITLTAVPNQNHTFVAWSGSPCVATGNVCVVTMNTANLITAEFMAPDDMFKNGFE